MDFYFRKEDRHSMQSFQKECYTSVTMENVTVAPIDSEDRSRTQQCIVKAVGHDKLLPVSSVSLSQPFGNEKESLLLPETKTISVSEKRKHNYSKESENSELFISALPADSCLQNESTVTHHTRYILCIICMLFLFPLTF